MRELKIVQCVIEQEDRYFLQYRSGSASIGAAGLLGCFGGKIEPNETPEQAIIREVAEETNLALGSSDLEYLGKVQVVSDYQNQLVNIKSRVYGANIPNSTVISAKEGMLFPVRKDSITAYYEKMTPATRALFGERLKGEI